MWKDAYLVIDQEQWCVSSQGCDRKVGLSSTPSDPPDLRLLAIDIFWKKGIEFIEFSFSFLFRGANQKNRE